MPMGSRAQDMATLSSLLDNMKNIYSVDDGNFFMLLLLQSASSRAKCIQTSDMKECNGPQGPTK